MSGAVFSVLIFSKVVWSAEERMGFSPSWELAWEVLGQAASAYYQ